LDAKKRRMSSGKLKVILQRKQLPGIGNPENV
jgi:hypothetical protein